MYICLWLLPITLLKNISCSLILNSNVTISSKYRSTNGLNLTCVQIPHYWHERTPSTFYEDVLSTNETDLSDRARLDVSVQQLVREARAKTKSWVICSTSDHVDVAFKKVSVDENPKPGHKQANKKNLMRTHSLQVEDGYPLPLWRGTVEVEAPQKDVFQHVLREQGQWQTDLQHSEVETLDKDSEIYQYTLQAVGTRPPLQHLLLRY